MSKMCVEKGAKRESYMKTNAPFNRLDRESGIRDAK